MKIKYHHHFWSCLFELVLFTKYNCCQIAPLAADHNPKQSWPCENKYKSIIYQFHKLFDKETSLLFNVRTTNVLNTSQEISNEF